MGIDDRSIHPGECLPVTIFQDRFHKRIRDPHRVVRILTRYGPIGLAIEVGTVAGRNKRGHFLLLPHLPFNEVHDLGMIQIQTDHLRRSTGDPSRLGRTSSAVEHFQKAHQARGITPTREFFLASTDLREIGSGSRTVLE